MSKTTRLQELLHARRLEILAERQHANASAFTTEDQPSVEEQLLQELQDFLFRENLEPTAPRAPKVVSRRFSWALKGASSAAILILTFITIIVSVNLGQGDAIASFKYLAVAATVLALIAATIRLLAHGGSSALDGVGKSLGLVSAILAAATAIALLLFVDLVPGVELTAIRFLIGSSD